MTLRLQLFALGVVIGLSIGFVPVHAQDAASSTNASSSEQVSDAQSQITELQNEISQLQTELNATTAQKQTLQSAVDGLNLQIKKLTTSITLTNDQIVQADNQIGTLSGTITTTQGQIGDEEQGVAQSLRNLQVADAEPLFLSLLGGGTLSSFFNDEITLGSVRDGLEDNINTLLSLKTNLQTSKTAAQTKRQQLATLQANLSQQKQGLVIAQQSQTELLSETQDKQSSYQTLIAQKQSQESEFEQDLLNYQKGLTLKVDVTTLPPTGAQELQWPLPADFMAACPSRSAALGNNKCITQFFGNTPFATQNPQIYSGQGHSGIDIGAPPGTPVLAARDGIVLGTGNTDLTCPNASFGKWIFIEHDDGLSTLYAHLGSFTVAKGDTVTTGEVIGYSDTTGYATGPHLHFGVYASSGSEISSFASQGCPGKTYTMPVGDLSAYLNPLSYLPPL